MPDSPPGGQPDRFPAGPHHSCGGLTATGFVATLRPSRVSLAPLRARRWRQLGERRPCPGCVHDRALRYARQIRFEFQQRAGMLYWRRLDEDGFRRFTSRGRKRRQRSHIDAPFQAFPQGDGSHIVIHDQPREGGRPLPDGGGALLRWLLPWLRTPAGRRVSSSRGWGGPWQRCRGDGRLQGSSGKPAETPLAQLWHHRGLAAAAGALGIQLGRGLRGSAPLPAEQALAALRAAGIPFHTVGGRAALAAILAPTPPETPPAALSRPRDREAAAAHLSFERDNSPHPRKAARRRRG